MAVSKEKLKLYSELSMSTNSESSQTSLGVIKEQSQHQSFIGSWSKKRDIKKS